MHRKQRGIVLFGLSGAMLAAAAALGGGYYWLTTHPVVDAPRLAPQAQAPQPVAGQGRAHVASWQRYLESSVTLVMGKVSVAMPLTALGGGLVVAELPGPYSAERVTQLAAAGAVPIMLDRAQTTAVLLGLKQAHDHAPINAYLDLEHRTIVQDKDGVGIDVFAALVALEAGLRAGKRSIELPMVKLTAVSKLNALGIDDISHVLGTYTTKFSVADRDRNFNLKLAASKLNGKVLRPGELFSFNETVGERSEKMGYKIAHVIDAGEMVDGLAGGTCQISTTLFGASFFAGLEIVKTTNHSRPSTYTPLGFDATVVWPNTDLKLRNPYDFPVVIHFRVANGESTVELLGKNRPWDKIEFERKIIESTPYPTEERMDDAMPLDVVTLDQGGYDGYKLHRFRRFYKDGKEVKTEKWVVEYRPVTEYVRRGTNLDPLAKMPDPKDVHLPKVPDSESFTLAQ